MTTPLLRLLAGLLALGALTACSTGQRPNVVLFFVDTLRADRVGAYGGERSTSPVMDRLADEGVRFADAQAPSPWTLPSAASMLTGLHPYRHGAGIHDEVRNLDKSVPTQIAPDVETLAGRLARAGYRCEAYVANPHLQMGLAQSFDPFVCRNTEGAVVANYGVDSLRRHAGSSQPFFLLLHFMDVHDPLLVPAEEMLAVTDPESADRVAPTWARSFSGHKRIQRARYRTMRLLAYDAAIHYVDRQIGRVVDELERQGLSGSTLVIVTSDHGEEVFDHLRIEERGGFSDPRGFYGIGHGHSLFREQLWVPLILRGPGIGPRVVDEQVTLMDIVPTVLDYARLAPRDRLDGRSLRPLIEGGELEPEPLLAGSVAYGTDRRAWVTPEWKLVVGGSEEEATLLYDRRNDPDEHDNLAEIRVDVVRELRARMEAAEASMQRRRGAVAEVTDEDELNFRALGYAGGEEALEDGTARGGPEDD